MTRIIFRASGFEIENAYLTGDMPALLPAPGGNHD